MKGAPYPPNLPDSPRTSLHGNRRVGEINFSAFLGWRLPCREVLVRWEVRGGKKCGYRGRLVGVKRFEESFLRLEWVFQQIRWVFHRLSTGCGKGVGNGRGICEKDVETARNAQKARRKRVEKRKKRGCGKLRGKRGKLFGESGEIEFSTGSAGIVFRCGERLTGIRAKCDNPCRRSGDVGRNPTGFPVISDGFGITFPIRVVPKTAEKPFRNGFLRNFWVFHSLHTPYYDYYDFYFSFFPSSLSHRERKTAFAGLQACRAVAKSAAIALVWWEKKRCFRPHQLTSFHFYPVAGAKRKLTKFRLTEFCAGAAGT